MCGKDCISLEKGVEEMSGQEKCSPSRTVSEDVKKLGSRASPSKDRDRLSGEAHGGTFELWPPEDLAVLHSCDILKR